MGWSFYTKTGLAPQPAANEVLSTGTIVLSVLPDGASAPDGFLFCEGQSVSKNPMDLVNYLALYSVIGDLFGPWDVNNFTLPDFRGKMPRGISDSASGLGYLTGTGGQKTHSHTLDAHSHAITTGSLHSHTVAGTHFHTFDDHTHELNNHSHDAGTLTVGNSLDNFTDIQDTSNDQDTVLSTHRHGINVLGSTATYTGGADSDPETSASTGSSSYSLNSHTFVAASSGVKASFSSDLNSGLTSTSGLPPYFTLRFLIKT